MDQESDEVEDFMHLLYLDLTASMQYIRFYFTTDPELVAEAVVTKEELVERNTTLLTSVELTNKVLETVNSRCNVCFEDIHQKQDQTYLLVNACQHVFHKDCVLSWLVQHLTCPLCRQCVK